MTVSLVRLPLPEPAIRQAYDQLVAELDRRIDNLVTSRFAGIMQCRAGCDSCCIRFSVLPLEAALVAQARQAAAVYDDPGGEKCSLLSEGKCRIYSARPIICRTQGLPLGYVDDLAGTIEVSACPINFAEDHPLVIEDLLLMDEFNQQLAELNAIYCRNAGLDSGRRIPLHQCKAMQMSCKE